MIQPPESISARAHIGSLRQYEEMYRLCYVRGPEGIVIALAQELG